MPHVVALFTWGLLSVGLFFAGMVLEDIGYDLRQWFFLGLGVCLVAFVIFLWLGWVRHAYTIDDDGVGISVSPRTKVIGGSAKRSLISWQAIQSYAFIHSYKGSQIIQIDDSQAKTHTIRLDWPNKKKEFEAFAGELLKRFETLRSQSGRYPNPRPSYWVTPRGRFAASSIAAALWVPVVLLAAYSPKAAIAPAVVTDSGCSISGR